MKQVYEIQSIRTNNFNDIEVMKKFGELWQTTMMQGHGLSVLYGVYHDLHQTIKAITLVVQQPKRQRVAKSLNCQIHRIKCLLLIA